MRRHIELIPFTALQPQEFGAELTDLVQRNAEFIRDDFPDTHALYADAHTAAETIRDRQHQMHRNLGFEALAVYLGRTAEDAALSGVAVHAQNEMSDENGTMLANGPQMSLWLDHDRPNHLRRVGTELMDMRMRRIMAKAAMSGHPWTFILQHNRASRHTWEYDGYEWGGFETVGQPQIYPFTDILSVAYQLYCSRRSLDEMRVANNMLD